MPLKRTKYHTLFIQLPLMYVTDGTILSVPKYQINNIKGPNMYAYECINKNIQDLTKFSYKHKNLIALGKLLILIK